MAKVRRQTLPLKDADSSMWTVFSLGAAFAAISAFLRVLVDGVKRTPKQIIAKVIVTSFWGGIAAWTLTEWLTVSPTLLGSISAVFGWAGYEATVSSVMRILGERTGVALGLDRRQEER
ncbi:hypothetical protein [Oceanithermus sp.]